MCCGFEAENNNEETAKKTQEEDDEDRDQLAFGSYEDGDVKVCRKARPM